MIGVGSSGREREKVEVKVEFAGCSRARIYLGPKEISDDTRADSTLGGRRKVGRDTGTKVSRFVIE